MAEQFLFSIHKVNEVKNNNKETVEIVGLIFLFLRPEINIVFPSPSAFDLQGRIKL
jgi:hypothetical protein